MYDILQLNDMLVQELKTLADKLSLNNVKKLSKQELIYKILDQQAILSKSKVAEDDEHAEQNKRKGRKPAIKKTETEPVQVAIAENISEKEVTSRDPVLPAKPISDPIQNDVEAEPDVKKVDRIPSERNLRFDQNQRNQRFQTPTGQGSYPRPLPVTEKPVPHSNQQSETPRPVSHSNQQPETPRPVPHSNQQSETPRPVHVD